MAGGVVNGGIPWWFWPLIIFFAYDDVFHYLYNPYALIPLILVAAFYQVCNMVGMGFIPS